MLAAKNSVKETEFWDPKWASGKVVFFFPLFFPVLWININLNIRRQTSDLQPSSDTVNIDI